MNNQSTSTNWSIGSDITCDLCIVNKNVAPHHALLVRNSSGWSIKPLDGEVVVAGKPASSTIAIRPSDEVRLSKDLALPWPSSDGAALVLTIGRTAGCDIVLDSPNVSSLHARLIIGPNATYVIEDANSTNGILHADYAGQRVKRLAIHRGMTFFFGTYLVRANDLIDAADRLKNPQRPISITAAESPPLLVTTEVKPSRRIGSAGVAIAIAASLLLVIAVSLIAFSVKDETAIAAPSGQTVEPNANKSNSNAVDVSVPSNAGRPTITAPNNVQPSNPADAVYWVVIETKPSNATFRIGTGVAISPKQILTTGAVVLAAQQLRQSMNGVVQLIHVQSGTKQATFGSGIHPEWSKRLSVCNQIESQLAELDELTDDDPAKAEQTERLLDLGDSALESASAVDIGWIETEQTLVTLPVVSTVTLRPNQEARLVLCEFPSGDPFYDPAEDRTVSIATVTIKSVGPAIANISGAVRLAVPDLSGKRNYFGCPLIISGKLAGIISFNPIDQNDQPMLRAVGPDVINRFVESSSAQVKNQLGKTL